MSGDERGPEVFGDGDVTVVVGNGPPRVYVGQTELRHVQYVRVGQDHPRVEVGFPRGAGPDAEKEIEESMRAAAACPHVRVTR